jgi:hypothetical protein
MIETQMSSVEPILPAQSAGLLCRRQTALHRSEFRRIGQRERDR